jgi:hypothetical protein
MDKKVKVPYQGKQVDGLELEFKTKKEEWSEYEISDGTGIRMKLVVLNIVRLKDEYDPEGNPIYIAKSTTVISASPPEHLKKGATVS